MRQSPPFYLTAALVVLLVLASPLASSAARITYARRASPNFSLPHLPWVKPALNAEAQVDSGDDDESQEADDDDSDEDDDSNKPENITGASSALTALRSRVNSTSTPRVFFLFLTRKGPDSPDLWGEFFGATESDKYHAFIHCSDAAAPCVPKSSSGLKSSFALTRVPTVPTEYCEDLVSAMVQLLKSATAVSTSPRDKFVFVSESTLPVKPFAFVYSALIGDASSAPTGSDFCFFPSSQWEKVKLQRIFQFAKLVKHSQWVILTRAHALKMVADWPQVAVPPGGPPPRPYGEVRWSLPVFPEYDQRVYKDRLSLCTDEWAFFATLHGAVKYQGTGQPSFALNGMSTPSLERGGHVQGMCRTFAFWGGGTNSDEASQQVAAALGARSLSCYPECDGSHPASITELSAHDLLTLRSSSFLFARKFQHDEVKVDAFKKYLLADVIPST